MFTERGRGMWRKEEGWVDRMREEQEYRRGNEPVDRRRKSEQQKEGGVGGGQRRQTGRGECGQEKRGGLDSHPTAMMMTL